MRRVVSQETEILDISRRVRRLLTGLGRWLFEYLQNLEAALRFAEGREPRICAPASLALMAAQDAMEACHLAGYCLAIATADLAWAAHLVRSNTDESRRRAAACIERAEEVLSCFADVSSQQTECRGSHANNNDAKRNGHSASHVH